jgi:PLP dependent protein
VSIAENLERVRSQIEAAARRSGRTAADILLIAVSKTFGVDAVREAWAAGQRDFGENRVQEALQKISSTTDITARWHLIGHLQSNKARKAVGPFSCIHSVDSMELLQRLDSAAASREEGSPAPDVLIQVDFVGEASKFGAPPDAAEQLVHAAQEAQHVRLQGLMLMPPWNEDPEQTRPWFVRLREFRDRLLTAGIASASLRHLSMGMSHDFEAAIEEGATLVRVGTAIFGKRSRG